MVVSRPLCVPAALAQRTQDNPPPYDYATAQDGTSGPPPAHARSHPTGGPSPKATDKAGDTAKAAPPAPAPAPAPALHAGPSYGGPPPPVAVHYYVDPLTGARVASALPPDHPEMLCLQEGQHVPHTRFGLLGAPADSASGAGVPLTLTLTWRCRGARGDRVVPVGDRAVSPGPQGALRALRGRALRWDHVRLNGYL